jgi:nitrogen fixation/metabolism regulation signal transduction histidine kinase
MAKRLAHEVKNPLTPIKLSAERLSYSYETKPAEFPEILAKTTATIINETKRLENLVNEFSKFARLPSPKFEHKDILRTLTEVIEFFANAFPDFQIKKEFEGSENGKFYLQYDESQIKQVIINIMNNAMDACAGCEKSVTVKTFREEDKFALSFRDRGKGIPPEAQDKIFEPYFTTKPHGSGIGLAIAERIMLEHGGNIWFESGDTGTVFYLEFPLKPEGPIDAIL